MKQLPCPCSVTAKQSPDEPAIIDQHGYLSYHQLDLLVDTLAQRIETLGIQKGEPLLVYGSHSRAMVALFFACLRANVVYAPVSLRIPPAQILSFAKQIQAHHLVHNVSLPSELKDSSLKLSQLSINAENPKNIENREIPHSNPEKTLELSQRATILQTSGSTGTPKAALHLLKNHYYNALGSNQNISLQPGDKWLLSLPLYHVAGIAILMRCVLSGAAVVLETSKISEPSDHLRHSINLFQPTHFSFVTTQLSRLLKENQQTIEQLQQAKAILLGGSAIPQKWLTKAHQLGFPIHTSYGATEMSSQIATTPPKASLEQLMTSGNLLAHRQLKMDENNEILVSGETLFAGYINGEWLEDPSKDGWFATGDIGQWNEDGSLQVIGRKDAMFISGGENIQPEEIEKALEQHQNVERAIVVDIKHDEFGARPCAFVKMRDNHRIQSKLLRSYLKQHIAKYKIPDRFYHWPCEEKQTGIKISRSQLRKIAQKS